MALDDYYLDLCENNKINGILRFYRWNVPSLSIGYFFKKKYLNINKLKKKKIPVVRRITGGNLLYHDNDISYSLILKKDLLNLYTVKYIYLFISSILKNALYNLGIISEIAYDYNKKNNPLCFGSVSQYEIVNKNGNKIIASSQKILSNAFLQHGSFYSDYDYNKSLQYLKFRYKIFFNNKNKKILTLDLNEDKLVKEFENEFKAFFNFKEIFLDDKILKNINELIINRYNNDEWTFRK